MQNKYDIIVIGGGAAGFFAAIRCAELQPTAKIILLEKGKRYSRRLKFRGVAVVMSRMLVGNLKN